MNITDRHIISHYRYTVHLEKWLVWPAYLLFFMMLFVPTTYQSVKAFLLAGALLTLGVKAVVRRKLYLHRTILLWTLLMLSAGLLFILIGVVNNAPGALRVSTVYLLWPFVYTVMITGINSRRVVDGIFKMMVFSLIAISLYSIHYLLYAADWLPPGLYVEINMGQAVGFYNGYTAYRLYNISTLNYLVPLLVAMVMTWPKKSDLPVARLWIWIACLLGLGVGILSGRRAVWLVMMISPLLVIMMRFFMTRQFKLAINKEFGKRITVFLFMTAAVFLMGAYVVHLDVHKVWQQFVSGFDFSTVGTGESVRREQFFALLDGWWQSPLWGAGCGASAPKFLRSPQMPWAYELSYVSQLFHTGLIGLSIYSAGIIWIFRMGIKIMRSGHWLGIYMLPVLVGTACFLIANATNPYLGKFDYIWVIFLPVALINIWLLDRSNYKQSKRIPGCQQ